MKNEEAQNFEMINFIDLSFVQYSFIIYDFKIFYSLYNMRIWIEITLKKSVLNSFHCVNSKYYFDLWA